MSVEFYVTQPIRQVTAELRFIRLTVNPSNTVIQLKGSFIVAVSCQATMSFSVAAKAFVPDTFEVGSRVESMDTNTSR